MKIKKSKRLSGDLAPDFHDEVKDMAKVRAKTLKSYFIDALREHFENDREEDRMWNELAKNARKKGFASVEESEDLLNSIRNA
ncbi:MAG: hypothetical protein F4073_05625 [Rhodobacteraceae bacterium]|nr:hypothetical protein [Paracoccaceae bacterium]MYF45069.1 hypothetical protein [Paracoccaceae bacterium]MYI91417.1 hypothetical protein [Paracoccaceae bacterium]